MVTPKIKPKPDPAKLPELRYPHVEIKHPPKGIRYPRGGSKLIASFETSPGEEETSLAGDSTSRMGIKHPVRGIRHKRGFCNIPTWGKDSLRGDKTSLEGIKDKCQF
jgi:hypothetical protein